MISYATVNTFTDSEIDEYSEYIADVRHHFNIPILAGLNLVGVSPDGTYKFSYYDNYTFFDLEYMNIYMWKKVKQRQKFFKLLNSHAI